MDVEDNILELVNIPQVNIEAKDISLHSLEDGHGDRDTIQERSTSVNDVFLLKFLQSLQDTVIHYQNKFKTYESLSEYTMSLNVDIFEKKQWKDLQYLEIEVQLQNFGESIKNLFHCMDVAVVRLREENNKLNETFKAKHANSKIKELIGSEDIKCQTLSSLTSVSNLEDLIKKKKKQNSKINELKNTIKSLETNLVNTEETLEKCEKENKKMKKQLRSSKDECEESILDEISKIHKEMKKLTASTKSSDDVKRETNACSDHVSVKLERKLEMLLELYENQEKTNQRNFDRTFDQINSLRESMTQLKGQNFPTPLDRDVEDVDALHDKIEELEKIIESKGLESETPSGRHYGNQNALHDKIEELENIIESKDREFEERLKALKLTQEEDVQTLDKDLSSLIVKCNKCNERMSSNMVDENDDDNATEKLINQDELIIQKNQAIITMRNKITDFKQKEASMENEIKMLKDKIKELESEFEKTNIELEKKSKAVTVMKDKLKEINHLKNSVDETEQYKTKFNNATLEVTKLKEKIASFEIDLNKKNEDFEIVKKNNLRLENELNNMKKLNFQTKTGKK